MLNIDLKNSCTFSRLQLPVAKTATFTSGSSVDLASYVGAVVIDADVGTVSGTTPTLDIKIQDSADNSSFADITGATFTQITATGIAQIALAPGTYRRYIQAIGTIAGTTPSFIVGIQAIGQKQRV